MKRFSLLLLWTSFSLFAQSSDKICEKLSKINTLIQQFHYQPKPIDDSLSVYVFDAFIDDLDPNRNLFTKTEYQQLCKHRKQLDNYIATNNCSFMNDFVTLYQQALERKKKVILKIQNIPFDYNSNDSVKFSKKSFPFDLAETDLERVWKKRMRFEILEDIAKISTNLDSLSKNFVPLEKKAKAKLFDNYLCQINSTLTGSKGLAYDLQIDFLNVFCTYFDPHSNYFSMDAKSNFMSSLSTSNLTFGMELAMNEKDEIVVAEVVPGGPASKSEKIEREDCIIRASNKKGEDYTVSCASVEKMANMIFSETNSEIEFTIRKKDGSTVVVLLKKQLMKATSNNVYSYILEKETKIGYINIPSFYSDFDANGIQGCADDVAKEIVKLQKDNINGLIIDLQDNGGGSMEEAIKLAGMFVDAGPISILVDNKNKQNVLKDSNRGSVYNGPIVILINGNSASASEFFAAAMQDYNRAIIVGTTSLGKASMQNIMPLDENNSEDFVKLTIRKFYRVTGESHQIKGIVPDISIPALFDKQIPRETSYKRALKYDSIITKYRFTPLTNNFSNLSELSYIRTKKNARFNEIIGLNKEIDVIYNSQKKPIRITLNDLFKEIHEIDPLWKKVKKLITIESSCKISNNSFDSEKMQYDDFLKESNIFKIKDLKVNSYIDESIAILNDYIILNK